MIDIKYNREKFTLSVIGHAGSDEYGKDLVCCAVSILFLTLSENIESSPYVLESNVRSDSGYGKIECVPTKGNEERLSELIDYFVKGFQMLSEEYHEFIKLNFVDAYHIDD